MPNKKKKRQTHRGHLDVKISVFIFIAERMRIEGPITNQAVLQLVGTSLFLGTPDDSFHGRSSQNKTKMSHNSHN